MSLKVLVLLSLVAAAAAGPAPTLGILGDVVGGIVNVKENALGAAFQALFGNAYGAKNQARNILTQLLDIKIQAFSDVLTLGVKVTLALGDIIDASINGLGTLVVRIVACTLKIVVCFLGSPGNNAICSDDWNTQFGVEAKGAADIKALISLYGVTDCQSKVQSLINIYTRGLGLAQVGGSIKIVLRVALDLAARLNVAISGSGQLQKKDLSDCFLRIGTLLGVIGNSHKSGLGLQIVKNFFPVCNQYISNAGYPGLGNWEASIQADINLGNNDFGPWSIVDIDANAGANVGLGQLIGGIFKGIIGVTRLAANLVTDILNIVLNSFDNVITLAVKIILGLGGLLDATVAGLGSLLVRIVAALIKIVLCFLGGSGNYGVCKSGWNAQFGISGEASSIDDLITLYGVSNCRQKVQQYVSDYTNGKGVDSTSGSLKVLLQSSLTLSRVLDSRKYDKSVLVIVFRHLTYLLGAIGNSNVKGAGTQVCNKFIPAVNKFLVAEGYNGFGDEQANIIKVVELGNGDNYLWSADINPSANKGSGFINVPSGTVGGSGSGDVGVSIGGGLGGLLGGIFGVLRGVTSFASNLITDILNIKINAFVDVLNLVFKLSLGIGGVIDTTIKGLGLLLSRIIAVIFKIGICVKGFPGDQSICNSAWNKQYGIEGDATTAAELIVLFKLGSAQSLFNDYVNTYTKGKGVSSTSGSVRIILDQSSTLIGYVTNYDQISKQTITNTFVSLTTITAAIANSNKKDSGLQITKQVIPTCGKYFTEKGYPDITESTTTINVIIVKANGDNVTWSKDNNSGNNDTGNSSGATTQKPSGKDTGNNDDTSNDGNKDNNDNKSNDQTGGDKTDNSNDSTKNTGGDKTDKNDSTTQKTGGDNKDKNGETTTQKSGGKDKDQNGGATTEKPSGSSDVDVTVNIGVDISDALKGFVDKFKHRNLQSRVNKQSPNIVSKLSTLKINSFEEVITLMADVSLAIGGILDSLVLGLGTTLSRMVAVIIKNSICGNAYSGPKNVCGQVFNARFGINGDGSSIIDTRVLFRVDDSKTLISKMLNDYTKGKGISSLSGSLKIVFQKADELAGIATGEVNKQAIPSCFVNLFTIFGAITNSFKKNSGSDITPKIVKACNPYFVSSKYPDVISSQKEIDTTISSASNDKVDWKSAGTLSGQTDAVVKASGLISIVRGLFGKLKVDNTRVKQTTFTSILNLEIPRSLDDFLINDSKIIQAIGSFLNLFIKNLGSLIIRSVGSITRYTVCVLGGAITKDSFVCKKAYYNSFGVSVSGTGWANIAKGFKVTDVKTELDGILKAYNSKGLEALKGAEKTIFTQAYALAALTAKGTKMARDDLTALLEIVVTIIGSFANSVKADLGKQICDGVAPVLDAFLQQKEYRAFQSAEIYTNIEKDNNVQVAWSASIKN